MYSASASVSALCGTMPKNSRGTARAVPAPAESDAAPTPTRARRTTTAASVTGFKRIVQRTQSRSGSSGGPGERHGEIPRTRSGTLGWRNARLGGIRDQAAAGKSQPVGVPLLDAGDAEIQRLGGRCGPGLLPRACDCPTAIPSRTVDRAELALGGGRTGLPRWGPVARLLHSRDHALRRIPRRNASPARRDRCDRSLARRSRGTVSYTHLRAHET